MPDRGAVPCEGDCPACPSRDQTRPPRRRTEKVDDGSTETSRWQNSFLGVTFDDGFEVIAYRPQTRRRFNPARSSQEIDDSPRRAHHCIAESITKVFQELGEFGPTGGAPAPCLEPPHAQAQRSGLRVLFRVLNLARETLPDCGCMHAFLRFDHGLVYLADGSAHFFDVGHNLERPAIETKDRTVQGVDPDLLAVFADTLVFGRLRLASI